MNWNLTTAEAERTLAVLVHHYEHVMHNATPVTDLIESLKRLMESAGVKPE